MSYSPTFGYDICARRIGSQSHVADRFDLSRWRVAGNGADMIRPDVMQAFVDAFADAGFKASRSCPATAWPKRRWRSASCRRAKASKSNWSRKPSCRACPAGEDRPQRFRAIVNCGKPCRDMRVEIREEDGTPLPERAIGKVWCSGPSLMTGYFRDPEATAACMAPDADGSVGSTPATWGISATAISTSSAAPRT